MAPTCLPELTAPASLPPLLLIWSQASHSSLLHTLLSKTNREGRPAGGARGYWRLDLCLLPAHHQSLAGPAQTQLLLGKRERSTAVLLSWPLQQSLYWSLHRPAHFHAFSVFRSHFRSGHLQGVLGDCPSSTASVTLPHIPEDKHRAFLMLIWLHSWAASLQAARTAPRTHTYQASRGSNQMTAKKDRMLTRC